MSVKIGIRLPRTLAGRLALVYAILSGFLSLIMIFFLSFTLLKGLEQRFDDILILYADGVEKQISEESLENIEKILREEDYENESESGFIQLLSPTGDLLASSDLSSWKSIVINRSLIADLKVGEPVFFSEITSPKTSIRFLYRKTRAGITIVVGTLISDDGTITQLIIKTAAVFVVIMIIGGIGIGIILSRLATKGIKKVTVTASHISKGNFDIRMPTGQYPEEIEQLARTFNLMIDKIDKSIRELKTVSNSVAHDLRSPLTRIRGNIEVTLRGSDDLQEYKIMAENVIEDCGKLETMINTMLEIAAMDSGIEIMDKRTFDICEILDDAEELFSALAEFKNQQLCFEISERPIMIHADLHKIQRIIANCLDNAIKFTEENGKIGLVISQFNGGVNIRISDSGPGITADDLPKIFDPFYRGDKSRSERGNGLGLSYVQSTVNNHGGNISVTSSPGEGTEFDIWLPTT
ncbi:HAMP domain-containing histidine kinase [bacterium]|nr:HAMP domain-containing histidine kinase [bacterium]